MNSGWEGGTILCSATQPNLKKDDTLILPTERGWLRKWLRRKKTMWNTIQVDVQTVNDQIAIINLAGDLTTQAEKAVRAAYQQVSKHNVSNIIFNFRADDYVDSAGLLILIKVITEARRKNQQLIMTVPSAHSQRIFNLIGINHYANICNTLDEALGGLKN